MGDFSGDPTVTYAGWTYKEGSLVKNWKKRFLVVKRRELAYYKTTDHTSRHAQLMGGMRIARAEITDGITNGLRITSVEGRELKIFMDTAAERDRCYNAIVEWCHPGGASAGATATAPPTTTRPARKSAPQQPQQPPTRMTGWLEKQGQNMPTWKRRFFVLEDGILSYSTQEGKASLARHRVLGVRRDRTKPFTLELRLDTGRDLRVSASNEHDLNDWHRAIQATIQSAAHRDRGSSHPPSQHDGRTVSERSIARPMLSEPQDSFNLFGAPPAAPNDAATAEDERRNANMSFGHSIRLDFDGENTSFIEVEAPPAVKPWSPTAPGPETIRKMRIEQNLLLDSDDEDDFEISTVASSTSKNTGSSSPVPSRRPQDRTNRKRKHEQAAGPGACCCIVM